MPPPGTPLMITSQHPLRIVTQTPKTILERPWRLASGAARLFPLEDQPSALHLMRTMRQFRTFIQSATMHFCKSVLP